eukprot:NODE_6642_length_350_cov_23.368771_g5916_i0.p2 GENE.NODE_6642_length_350_cov_23.368771_g5916_i0~~NODE_6642_length_350_cov_23.368771_g5916_i0.p2  ORF type:complete len:66 (+),score=1.43 NODE_6642_length_350_cov_23.368771_g5916_i0:76-273(+)
MLIRGGGDIKTLTNTADRITDPGHAEQRLRRIIAEGRSAGQPVLGDGLAGHPAVPACQPPPSSRL